MYPFLYALLDITAALDDVWNESRDAEKIVIINIFQILLNVYFSMVSHNHRKLLLVVWQMELKLSAKFPLIYVFIFGLLDITADSDDVWCESRDAEKNCYH